MNLRKYRNNSKGKNNRILYCFTLLEMIVSLAVFLILIAVVLNFYDSIFKVSSSSRNNSEVFSNARTAMDIITRDIQCIYYKNGMIPFWHKSETDNGRFSNDLVAFISATPLPQSDEIISKLCEVKYQLYYTDDLEEDSAGWILRSVTGDDSDSWNFQYNFDVGILNSQDAAFTADTSSSDPYQKLIPYVTDLTFECYNKEGVSIDYEDDSSMQFPYSIRMELTLLDELSWNNKYKNATGDAARNMIVRENGRTFSKTIFVGEHGQGE